jgi:hypothetical protein
MERAFAMSDQPTEARPTRTDVQSNLAALAQLLRKTHHVGPEAQRELAEIVEELAKALGAVPAPSTEMAALAASTGHLVEALHEQKDKGILSDARARVEKAIVTAEAKAPFAAGIAQRLVNVLTDLGI